MNEDLITIRNKSKALGYDAIMTNDSTGGAGPGVVLYPSHEATERNSCILFMSTEHALAWLRNKDKN